MKKNKVPHIACFIVGYIFLCFILLLISAISIAAKFIFTSLPIAIAFLLLSYIIGYWLYKSS